MFSPPKLKTIVAALTALIAFSTIAEAQQAEYNRRMAAMQQAQGRALSGSSQGGQIRLVDAQSGIDYSAPPAPTPTHQQLAPPPRRTTNSSNSISQRNAVPQRIAQAPQQQQRIAPTQQRNVQPQQRSASTQQRMAQATTQLNNAINSGPSNRVASRYNPPSARTAQIYDNAIMDGGSPIVGAPGCASCGSGGAYEAVVDDGYYEDGYVDGGCSSCGDSCGFFEDCGDPCCGRGGCPPGPCWITGLGAALLNAEYFGGAQGFQNALANQPGTNNFIGDCSFGFYGGVNLGIPLCRLSCGLLSGQVGVRSVQSNFNGNEFSVENRDQLFVTTGIYRRVDYGLQAGIAADFLYESWLTDTDTIQLRSDLGWVYPGGCTLGFRYAANIQDDISDGTFNGQTFRNLITTTEDYYRFYLRKEACCSGYAEMFFGWTDSNQTIFGVDCDLPVSETVAMQAGFTYYLDETAVPTISTRQGGNLGDAWNVGVGFVWRPAGKSSYRSYDRPLFGVADNGSMLLKRQ